LSDAEKGEFSGFRRFISRKIDRFFRWQSRKHRPTSNAFVEANANASDTSFLKVPLSRRLSRSANSSPPGSFADKNNYYKDGEPRRITIAINAQGLSSVAADKQQLLMIRNELRRATHPRHEKDLLENRAPWKRTVSVVRRS
ncbi:hypothetical protein PMAYCL1PPCAC_16564, partial [Pristionchus mayeri]